MNEEFRRRLEAYVHATTENQPDLGKDLLEKIQKMDADGIFKRIIRGGGDEPMGVPLMQHAETLAEEHRIAPERVITLSAGQRPIARIIDNKVTLDFVGPHVPAWDAVIRDTQEQLNERIPAVGRIELVNTDIPWASTGWMIAEGIIVTNRHVAQEFSRRDRAGIPEPERLSSDA